MTDEARTEAVEHPLVLAKHFLLQQQELGAGRLPLSRAIDSPALPADTPLEAVPTQPAQRDEAMPAVGAATSAGDPASILETFHNEIRDCTACGLSDGRRVVVFGSGNPSADVMFIGEAPGADEDREGVPFVGRAGQLLTKMIEAIDFRREDVYIANVIKCRPPGNRDPEADEIGACQPFLMRQIDVIRPKIICTLGRFAAQLLLGSSESMGRLRGRVYSFDGGGQSGIKLIPTYHPSALLRNQKWKRPTWEDLKLLRREYDGKVI